MRFATLFGATMVAAQFDDENGLLQTNGQSFEEAQGCDESVHGYREEGYRGCQDHTVNGKSCQRWTSQSPHGHSRTPSNYHNKGLGNHNYCRNPDGEPNLWCYTTDWWTRWDYCAPKSEAGYCDENVKYDRRHRYSGNTGAGYRGCKDTTHTGRRCQMWTDQSPHAHVRTPTQYPDYGLGYHNYCRNPDGEPAIWCYTVDSSVRWDFCDHCEDGYTGDDCSVPPACNSNEHCNGHVTLDKDRTNGCECQCAYGWSGSDCTIPPPCSAATDCHGHGTTNDADKTNGCSCSCTDGFTGSSCATPPPCTANACSGHGTTHDKDATDGCDCTCSADYRGADCSIPPACSSEKHCNGHATLDKDSTDGCECHCSDGWSGDDCTIPPVCDAAKDCSGHGITSDKDKTNGCECFCTGGFSGADCSLPKICCRAMTADCLACAADLPASEYCALHPKVAGCAQHLPTPPKVCCRAMTVSCLACQADLTETEYCKIYPKVEGCSSEQDEVLDC